jgi:hypothetical protein
VFGSPRPNSDDVIHGSKSARREILRLSFTGLGGKSNNWTKGCPIYEVLWKQRVLPQAVSELADYGEIGRAAERADHVGGVDVTGPDKFAPR